MYIPSSMPRFYTPGRIIFGYNTFKDALEDCDTIVTSSSIKEKLEVYKDKAIEFKRSSKTGEPLEDDIYNLRDILVDSNPKCIAAVGGGSVIDATKLAIILMHSNLSLEDFYTKGIPRIENKLYLIGIETTAGTGTGVSAAAVVIDKDGIKHGLVSETLICDKAVYDPSLVISMSREVTAYSGMDALTHAIEAYTSTIDNLPADTMALKAIELAGKNILDAVNGDEKSREMMHYANMMAAFGFANSRLGMCHALSHKIGGRFNIPHGKINAMLLPYIIYFNSKDNDRYNDIASVLGLKDVKDIIKWLIKLNEEIGIPLSLSILGDEFYEMIPQIAMETEKDALMKTNPRKAEKEDIEKLLREAYERELITST
ncbi:MAG TPA: iron-containing alcohol dehydrogenase [Thermoplasmatales archaeon]|nr:iron-containing alcohol dehydrogenase [Thermoplasmatales archaeon]